jgi:hypothetical protein
MTISIGMILVFASLIGSFLAMSAIALCRGKPFSWIAGILGLSVGWLLFAIASATSRSRGADRQWHVNYEKLASNEFTFYALICAAIGLVFLLTAVFQKPPNEEEAEITFSYHDSSFPCGALPRYDDCRED